ncbi:Zinc finger protein [Plakobranchus ocellatus]|uniref:Zinc finger protein n=1 Tax=Plakobranchus ocellatus TaxID=259542 RepID=A0AAV3ZRA4_9GAST|nr:Zinc finger protein [Plakobranchus ocellatus]
MPPFQTTSLRHLCRSTLAVAQYINPHLREMLQELTRFAPFQLLKEKVRDLKFHDQPSRKEYRELGKLAGCFSSTFSDCPGSTILEEHRIELTSLTPVSSSLRYEAGVWDELKMENVRIMRKSNSAYASPVVEVKKKTDVENAERVRSSFHHTTC